MLKSSTPRTPAFITDAISALKFVGIQSRDWRSLTGATSQRTTPAPEILRVAALGAGHFLPPEQRRGLLRDRMRLVGLKGIRLTRLKNDAQLHAQLSKQLVPPDVITWAVVGEWPLEQGPPANRARTNSTASPPDYVLHTSWLSDAATYASNVVQWFQPAALRRGGSHAPGSSIVKAAISVLDLAHRLPNDEQYAALRTGGNLDPIISGSFVEPVDTSGVRKTVTQKLSRGRRQREVMAIDIRVFLPFVAEVLDLRAEAEQHYRSKSVKG